MEDNIEMYIVWAGLSWLRSGSSGGLLLIGSNFMGSNFICDLRGCNVRTLPRGHASGHVITDVLTNENLYILYESN
jgi:hypothetical protein